jgi:hypothetical protein
MIGVMSDSHDNLTMIRRAAGPDEANRRDHRALGGDGFARYDV